MALWYCGLDLGQSLDPTAFCAAEQRPGAGGPHFDVRALRRWELGTSYVQIVEDVVRFVAKPPLRGCLLAIDESGVGRPVRDLLRKARPACRRLAPVTITAGLAVTEAEGGFRVAKAVLISTLQLALQSRRLRFAEGLPETAALVKELENYRVNVTPALHETFDARSGEHDDLLLALALCVWAGSRPHRGGYAGGGEPRHPSRPPGMGPGGDFGGRGGFVYHLGGGDAP